MKTRTLVALSSFMLFCSILFGMQPAKHIVQALPHENSNAIWFHTIEISDGITVEFEYGSKLEVIVEDDQRKVSQVELILDKEVLVAVKKANAAANIHIKVITSGLVNLAKLQTGDDHMNDGRSIRLQAINTTGKIHSSIACGI